MIEIITILLALVLGTWGSQFDHAVVVSDHNSDGFVESHGSTVLDGYIGDVEISGQWHNLTYWYKDYDPYSIEDISSRVVRTTDWDRFTRSWKVTFTYDPEKYQERRHEYVRLKWLETTPNLRGVCVQYQVRHNIIGNYSDPQTWVYIERSDPPIQVWFTQEALAHSVYFGNWVTHEAGMYWY